MHRESSPGEDKTSDVTVHPNINSDRLLGKENNSIFTGGLTVHAKAIVPWTIWSQTLRLESRPEASISWRVARLEHASRLTNQPSNLLVELDRFRRKLIPPNHLLYDPSYHHLLSRYRSLLPSSSRVRLRKLVQGFRNFQPMPIPRLYT